MRRRVLHAQHSVGRINVTPMIDVVMCLIIFYLIVGRLAALRITLPTSATGLTDPGPKPLVIEVSAADGDATRLVVAERTVSIDGLESIVRDAAGADTSRAVEIRAARDLPYARLAPILRACRLAGLTSVRLAAEKSQ